MKIHKISTEELLRFGFENVSRSQITSNTLLCDEYFNIALAHSENGYYFKKMYKPLQIENYKNSFALFEILPSQKGFYVRVRKDKEVSGQELCKQDLNFFINSHTAFYNTFSVDDSLIDYAFERAIDRNFSLIHFFHQAAYGNYPLKSMAIVADPSGNLEGAYEEGRELYEWLSSLNLNIKLSFFSSPLSSESFDKILESYSVLHFCGHIHEEGLELGEEIYHPSFSQKKLPELLFLNGCKLFSSSLLGFIKRKAKNLIYFNELLKDKFVDIEQLKKFYAGILSGYRLLDVASKTLDFKSSRIYGWASNRFLL